ncbi:MAG: hypothetical protein ABFD60_15980 [Bryobacteraceae bacterium]
MRLLTALLLSVGLVFAQPASPPESILLNRIRAHVARDLKRLPNYTCIETIDRTQRSGLAHEVDVADGLRLEVAMVDNKELFAWPGADSFEDRQIGDLVQDGVIGSGNFAINATSVFLTDAASFIYVGDCELEGKKAVLYTYMVPVSNSRYKIRVPPKQAMVGFHGAFWVDAGTLDLMRLEVVADNIPAELGIAKVTEVTDYGRVEIRGEKFLLPKQSELVTLDLDGDENTNRARFSGCRQFTGESVLTFGDVQPEAPGLKHAVTTPIDLPPDLGIELKLETEVDANTSYVGDPVMASVASNVKQKGRVVIPKGTLAHGRITKLEMSFRDDEIRLGLRFSTLQLENGRAPFRAKLKFTDAIIDRSRGAGTTARSQVPIARVPVDDAMLPSGTLLVRIPGNRLKLPRGYRTFWRTISTGSEETQ